MFRHNAFQSGGGNQSMIPRSPQQHYGYNQSQQQSQQQMRQQMYQNPTSLLSLLEKARQQPLPPEPQQPRLSGVEGYQQQNAYAQPLGYLPQSAAPPAIPNPVDSQFAMGGHPMSRLVALAQQRRQQQTQPQSMIPRIAGNPGDGTIQVIPTGHSQPQSMTPESAQQGVNYLVDTRDVSVTDDPMRRIRPRLQVQATDRGTWQLQPPPGWEATAPTAEQQQLRDARSQRVQEREATMLANRRQHFGAPRLPKSGANVAMAGIGGSKPIRSADSPYVGAAGPVPGFGESQAPVFRAVQDSLGSPDAMRKSLESQGLDAKAVANYYTDLANRPNRFDGVLDNVFSTEQSKAQADEINRMVEQQIAGLEQAYPDVTKPIRERIEKEKKRKADRLDREARQNQTPEQTAFYWGPF